MSLYEEQDNQFFSDQTDHDYEDDPADLPKKKRIKKLLEERLERKRLKDEFKDDFDELSGDFDWDELDR